MNAKKFVVKFSATVVSAAVAAVGTSQVLDVAFWKTAAVAAVAAAMPILKKLLEAAKDGEITSEEAGAALEEEK